VRGNSMIAPEEHNLGFAAPPLAENAEGQLRRVGVELEMAGLDTEQIAATVCEVLGGTLERQSAFVIDVRGTDLGDFRVEIDADLLKSRGYQEHLEALGIDIGEGIVREHLEEIILRVAGLVVPFELVAPPVPWTELARVDALRAKLREAGARGTRDSMLYAFGMQLNVEAASLAPDYLLSILQAFLASYDALIEREPVDLSRRLTPYVQAYPEDYVAHVLQDDYRPDLTQLIDDFLSYTPTRNRPLDMLPLFAHLDEARVMAAPVERALVKPRPAFHYRLPNCRIDEPSWTIAEPWNGWVEVERLAADPQRLQWARAERLAGSSMVKQWLSEVWRRSEP
jgi:hypothetical protein